MSRPRVGVARTNGLTREGLDADPSHMQPVRKGYVQAEARYNGNQVVPSAWRGSADGSRATPAKGNAISKRPRQKPAEQEDVGAGTAAQKMRERPKHHCQEHRMSHGVSDAARKIRREQQREYRQHQYGRQVPHRFGRRVEDYGLAACQAVFFFFQAEDGIRDAGMTGVQTCALPILVNILC